ncbi:MAG: histidine kinase [Bacteroidales bacterium]|jgi:tetratricopeptide (TPR) repeat protein|nr:histidine kinase [Bacteroidales bacterium]
MKNTIYLILLFGLQLPSTGQIPGITRQKTVDSLFVLLKNSKNARKVDLLNQLSLNLAPRSFDSGFRFATEALCLSKKLNYPRGKGIATFNLGNSYFFKSDIKNALTNYLSALRLLEPFEPAKEIGDLLYQLGSINQYVRNTEKMFDYYNRAARNFLTLHDTSAAIVVYFTLGCPYYYKLQTLEPIDPFTSGEVKKMMDSTIRYNNIVLDYYLKPHADYKWAPVEAWLANVYNAFGCFYQAEGDSMALDYYLKALEQARAIADTNIRNFLEGLMCANLGYQFYFFWKNPDRGYDYAKSGIVLLKRINRYDITAGALSILGRIELDKGRFRSAEKNFFQALNYSDTFLFRIDQIDEPNPTFRLAGVTQLRSQQVIIFRNLVRLFELTGDLKNALLYQKKLEEGMSLQMQDELTRQVIGLEEDHKDVLKRQEIAGLVRDNELRRLRMNQTRILFAGLGGVALIAFLVFVVWIQRKRFRSDQKALILEQKLLRSQMNPHFIFNSLTNIQNFILTEKPDKASIYLSKFAMLVRNILDNSVEEYVVLEKEISTIENYLELQKVRFSGKFDYSIHIADEIDTDTLKIPPMLAQPFIENAIEHGIKHRETPGHIDISFSLKDHVLIFEVEDNGIGRQKAHEIRILKDPEHKSMATSLTRERLANLNRKMKEKIRLEIFDLKNAIGEASGTKVTFGIPLSK